MWGARVIDEVQDLDSADDKRGRKSGLEAKRSGQRNPQKSPEPEGGLKDKPWRKRI